MGASEEARLRKCAYNKARRDARTPEEADAYRAKMREKARLNAPSIYQQSLISKRRRELYAQKKVEGETNGMTYSSNFTAEQREAYNKNRREQRARQRDPRGGRGVHPTFALKRDQEIEAAEAERERAETKARLKQSRFYRPSWAEGDHHV